MRTGWVLLLLAFAGAAAWWLLPRPSTDGVVDSDPTSAPRGAPDAPSAPTLVGVTPAAPAAPRGEGRIHGKVQFDGAAVEAEVTLRVLADPGFFERRFEDPAGLLAGLFDLDPAPETPALRTVRSVGGAFAFEGLGQGVYRVNAKDAAGHQASAVTALLERRLAAEVTLALASTGETLEGRVVWSDGRAVAGRVAASSGDESDMMPGLAEPQGSTELDGEGRFRLEGLRAGMLMLRVLTTEGVLAIHRGVVVPSREPVVVTLDAVEHTVRGRVVSAVGEAPVADAAVMAVFGERRGDTKMQFARATSAADGGFAVLAGALPVQLMALASGYDQGEGRAETADEVVVRLRPLGGVRGRVVAAADGRPVEGAGVVASGGPREHTATSGPDGRFEIVGIEGRRVTVMVRGGGWTSRLSADSDASYDEFEHALVPGQALELELLAVPGASLTGRVLDASGAGVAGARVFVQSLTVGRQVSLGHGASDYGHTTTDASGRFVLPDLPPDATVDLNVARPGGPGMSSPGHRVGGPLVEIRLETERWVDVTAVFDDDGSPVVGAELHVTAHSAGGTFGTGGERTDAKGRARLTAPRPGRLTVRLRGDALARNQPEIDVEGSDGDARELRATIRAQRGRELRGRVLLPDGRPAERVTVRATAPTNDHWSWDARTDRDGRFVLRGAGTDEVELKVNEIVAERVLRGHGRFRAGAGEIELRLSDVSEEFLTFELRVLDPEGRPVPRARVQALLADRGADSTEIMRGEGRWTTPRGSALEKALEAGTLWMEASGARSEAGEPLPFGPVRVGPLRPAERKVVLRMPPERVIEGRVLDPEGKGVASVEVVAEREVQRMGQGFGLPEARTDSQGRFRIGGLGEEARVLALRATGEFLTPEPEVFVPGGPPIEIRLERGRNARVRVLAPDGSPVTSAQVRAEPRLPSRTRDPMEMQRATEEGRRAARVASSGPDGAALLRGLDPTRAWDLSVTPPSNRSDLRPASLPAWSPADTEVTLEVALSVSGFVRDPGGAPLSGAFVYAQEAGGGYRGWPVDRQGAFLVTGVAKGEPVRLWAVASQGQHPDMQSAPLATAPAGSTGVVLVVDPGAALLVELVGFTPGDARTHPRILKVGRDGNLTHASFGQPTAEGGALRYGGFPPSLPLTVWVGPDAQGRYGLVRDVRAGGPVVRVRAQQGGSIRGTLRAPPDARNLSISAQQNGLQVSGDVTPQGAYEIRGLPPGRWTLHAIAVTDEGYVSATGEADVGGTLDLAPTRSVR